MSTAEEYVDAALGIDAAQIARIDRLCEQAFPARAPAIAAQIRALAKLLHSPRLSDEENLASFQTMTTTKGAEFTRATPTPEAYVALAEADAKKKGMEWGAAQRLAALRTAQAMTPEEMLRAVPVDFAPNTVQPSPPAAVAAPKTPEEVLDAEVEKRFGLPPGGARAMSALDRQRYHAALKKEGKQEAVTPAPVDPSRTDIGTTLEKINAARRAAK